MQNLNGILQITKWRKLMEQTLVNSIWGKKQQNHILLQKTEYFCSCLIVIDSDLQKLKHNFNSDRS